MNHIINILIIDYSLLNYPSFSHLLIINKYEVILFLYGVNTYNRQRNTYLTIYNHKDFTHVVENKILIQSVI